MNGELKALNVNNVDVLNAAQDCLTCTTPVLQKLYACLDCPDTHCSQCDITSTIFTGASRKNAAYSATDTSYLVSMDVMAVNLFGDCVLMAENNSGDGYVMIKWLAT